jgi:CheY-like chemotaxis protein
LSQHILVAEDEADIRDLLRLSLQGAGHEVTVVPDGRLALEVALSSPPRCVITDLRMPGMNGLELIRALRAEPALRSVPVILFTAYVATDPRVSEAREIEGVEVVTKGPISELRAAVTRALEQSEPGAA